MKEKRIGPATVRLLQGDITTCEVDGIINVTGKTLVPRDETARVLTVNACAEDLDPRLWDEDDDEIPIVITPPSNYLKAQHVLNAPTVETTSTAGAHKIRKTMRFILEEAQENALKTLAVPAIGSGIKRYPVERCAEILFEELARSVQSEHNSIEKVIFVLDTQKNYRIFEQVLEEFIENGYVKN